MSRQIPVTVQQNPVAVQQNQLGSRIPVRGDNRQNAQAPSSTSSLQANNDNVDSMPDVRGGSYLGDGN